MKSKKLLWILGIVLLVVGSVAVQGAIWDPLLNLGSNVSDGLSGITGGASILVFLVNILIVSVVLYFIMNIVGKKYFKSESKTGKVIFFIVLIFLAGVISYRVGNQWIWEENAFIRPAFNYLFSGSAPLGILRPTRILIFIGASFLLYWLLISTVKIGQGKNNKIDLAISILLAGDMTHQGLTSNWLISFGQIISIWLLYRQFKKEGESGWNWSAAVWSTGLVVWISAVAFPGKGFFVVRGLGTWFKTMGLYSSIIVIVILGVVLTAVGLFRNKKEKDAKKEKEESRWKKGIVAYPLAWLLNKLRKSRNPIIKKIYRAIDPNINTLEDEIPFPFRDVRVEFMTLMNYMLRLQVYKAKKHVVTDSQKFMDSEIYSANGLNQVFIKNKIDESLDIFKNSGEFELNSKGKFELINKSKNKVDAGGAPLICGFNLKERFVYELINKLKEFTENFTYIADHPAENIIGELNETLSNVDSDLSAARKRYGIKIDDVSKRGGFLSRKGAYNVLESKRLFLLDQYNLTGKYDHSYRFAKVGAQVYNFECSSVIKNPDNNLLNKAPTLSNPSLGGKINKTEKLKYEVDSKGYFISDLNEYIIKSENMGYIRKIDVKDIEEHDTFNDVSKWMESEWEFFIRDVRDGRFHKNSRSAKDYTDTRLSTDYSNVKSHSGDISRMNPAFDRQALLNPTFDYLGRRKYYGEEEKSVPASDNPSELRFNKSPALSTMGMMEYIRNFIETNMENDERFRQNLSRYVYDTGEEKEGRDIFTNAPAQSKKNE